MFRVYTKSVKKSGHEENREERKAMSHHLIFLGEPNGQVP